MPFTLTNQPPNTADPCQAPMYPMITLDIKDVMPGLMYTLNTKCKTADTMILITSKVIKHAIVILHPPSLSMIAYEHSTPYFYIRISSFIFFPNFHCRLLKVFLLAVILFTQHHFLGSDKPTRFDSNQIDTA